MIVALLPTWLEPSHLIETGSYLLIFGIIFAETGLLAGFFLPGDSLLFTAGVFAARGDLRISVLVVGCVAAAVIGDQVGYGIGNRIGPALLRRPNGRFFRHEHVERSQQYFDEHGSKTIVLARFVPIVRTFVPVLAGVGQMPYRRFVTFNVVGGVVWAGGLTLLGFTAGRVIGADTIDRYLLPIIGVIVVASVVPVILERRRHERGALDGDLPVSMEPASEGAL